MKLNSDQEASLKKVLSITRDEEINCNECLDRVAEFAERELQGVPVSAALEAVEHHLTLCVECREEYESLLVALKALED